MNIERVILLIGLPGAGKTTLGNLLLKNYPENEALFIDDIGMVTNDAKKYLSELKGGLKTLIISDVYFCDKRVLESAVMLLTNIFPNAEIERKYFENNVEKCLINISQRKKMGDNRVVERLVDLLSKKYEVDERYEKLVIKNK